MPFSSFCERISRSSIDRCVARNVEKCGEV
jgi:hypothetical protein